MPVPNSFANVTTSIPLSQLDANFNTPITLGNTAIQLGNTVTTLNNMTLANVTVTSGNVTITNVSVTTANVATANVTTSQILNYGTANGVAYLNTSKSLTTGTSLVFDSANTRLGVGIANPQHTLTLSNSTSVVSSISTGDNGSWAQYTANNGAGGTLYIGMDNSTGASFGAAAYAGVMWHGSAYPLLFANTNTERGRFDTSGRFLVGLKTAITSWGSGKAQEIQATASGATYPGFSSYAFSTTAGAGGMINLGRSRSTTVGTMTATQSGDTLGYLIFEGVNSSNALTGGGYISVVQSGAAGASYIPGEIRFYTSDATNGPTGRFTMNSTGAFVLQGGDTTANGTGITFPATQSASTNANTLDDYEEGDWTPTALFSTSNGNRTYTYQIGRYIKIGNLVHLQGWVEFSETTASGNLSIGGLPFAASSATGNYSCGSFYVNNMTGLSGMVMALIGGDTPANQITMFYSGTGGRTNISSSNTGSVSSVIFDVCYQTA